MRKHNPKNERIKRRYLAYLEEAKRQAPKSADQAAAAIALFEASTGYREFALFHIEQARRFKRDLHEQVSDSTGKPLAKATIHSRLMALRAFFQWLAGQPGYRRINYSDADYFNSSANDSRIASAQRERPIPSIEQIRHVVTTIDSQDDIARRDRALIAFALLSGARDDALASLSLRHVDLTLRTVYQDARMVRTKNRKTFTSWFFPVGDDIEAVARDWVVYLNREKLFGPDDPLFPATARRLDENGNFAAAGLERRHWKSADAIRRIFKQRFKAAGLPYFYPHLIRSTIGRLGEQICNPEEWKAWSQNLGHEHVGTTFNSYGKVASHRQAEIFETMRRKRQQRTSSSDEPDAETIRRVVEHLQGRAA
jgi:integrase